MKLLTTPVLSTDETVIQPIVNNITEYIKSKFRIEAKDIHKTTYELESTELQNNTYDNEIGKSELVITYENIQSEELNYKHSVFKPINKLILLDNSNGFFIRPIYLTNDLKVTFTYRNISKTNVNRIKDNIKLYFNNSLGLLPINVEYSYLIPDVVNELIKDIASLEGYDDYLVYIKDNETSMLDAAITIDGEVKKPVFRGIQSNLLLYFDTDPNAINIEKDETYHKIEFTIGTAIQVPYSLMLRIPLLVNNKPIPSKWLPSENIAKPIPYSESELDVRKIISSYEMMNNEVIGSYNIPTYDEFYPLGYDRVDTIRLINMLLEVDDEELLFNIDDLKYVGFPKYMVEYFKDAKDKGDDIFTFGQALYFIELFEFNNIKDKQLYIDDEYNVKAKIPLDKTKTYHISVSALTDLGYIHYFKDDNDEDKQNRDKSTCELMGLHYKINDKIVTYV